MFTKSHWVVYEGVLTSYNAAINLSFRVRLIVCFRFGIVD